MSRSEGIGSFQYRFFISTIFLVIMLFNRMALRQFFKKVVRSSSFPRAFPVSFRYDHGNMIPRLFPSKKNGEREPAGGFQHGDDASYSIGRPILESGT